MSTDRVAGVGVQLENRLVGRTDADGLLLVTPLHGWRANRLSVDALALPPDIALAEPFRSTVAHGRAGSLVRFPMRRVKAATIRLTDPAGALVPMGAQVRLASGSRSRPWPRNR